MWIVIATRKADSLSAFYTLHCGHTEGQGREMKKIITICAEFPDDFTPPNEFESHFEGKGNSECVRCPFYSSDTYEPYDDCRCPSEDGNCPIKKYF